VQDDIDLSWIRRTRIDGDDWAGFEVPLGEESEQYLVRVLQDGQVIREAQTTSATWRYDQNMRLQDGTDGPVTVSVAQISASYGAGPAAHLVVRV
jgi:hypothetical protein